MPVVAMCQRHCPAVGWSSTRHLGWWSTSQAKAARSPTKVSRFMTQVNTSLWFVSAPSVFNVSFMKIHLKRKINCIGLAFVEYSTLMSECGQVIEYWTRKKNILKTTKNFPSFQNVKKGMWLFYMVIWMSLKCKLKFQSYGSFGKSLSKNELWRSTGGDVHDNEKHTSFKLLKKLLCTRYYCLCTNDILGLQKWIMIENWCWGITDNKSHFPLQKTKRSCSLSHQNGFI